MSATRGGAGSCVGAAAAGSSSLSLGMRKAGMLADLFFISICSRVSRSMFLLSSSPTVSVSAAAAPPSSVLSSPNPPMPPAANLAAASAQKSGFLLSASRSLVLVL